MEPKKSKYDTNPLDPDFVKSAQEEWAGEDSRGETSEVGDRATREIRGGALWPAVEHLRVRICAIVRSSRIGNRTILPSCRRTNFIRPIITRRGIYRWALLPSPG